MHDRFLKRCLYSTEQSIKAALLYHLYGSVGLLMRRIGYIPFLFGVAIFAIGVVILHVAANLNENSLSSLETAASRLTLTNALNSGTTVIPFIFVSVLIV